MIFTFSTTLLCVFYIRCFMSLYVLSKARLVFPTCNITFPSLSNINVLKNREQNCLFFHLQYCNFFSHIFWLVFLMMYTFPSTEWECLYWKIKLLNIGFLSGQCHKLSSLLPRSSFPRLTCRTNGLSWWGTGSYICLTILNLGLTA